MKKIVIIFLAILSGVPALAQRKTSLFKGDFNKGLLNQFPRLEIVDDKAMTISDSVTRFGQKSMRVEVKSGDTGPKGIRCEIAFEPEEQPEGWYGFSMYAPANYAPDPEYEMVTQWHNVPDWKLGEGWLTPSLSLWVQNGNFELHTLWDTAKVTIQRKWMGEKVHDLGPVKLKKWTDWVFHVKFSYKDDGLVEVYRDGVKVYTQSGPNNFNDATLPYWKVGIYKPLFQFHDPAKHKHNQRVLFYSQIKKSDGPEATYADVAPRR